MKDHDAMLTAKRLLLLSNSTNVGQRPLGHATEEIKDFLGHQVKSVLFIPFAAVTFSFNDYAVFLTRAFRNMNLELTSLHNLADPQDAIKSAEVIVAGGGNTYALLSTLERLDVLETIRERVQQGVPYIGWSAGVHIACPTIRTTIDMVVTVPRSVNALNFVPFQVSPHFTEAHEESSGETRLERIMEFITLNPNTHVVAMRDGAIMRLEGASLTLLGKSSIRIFGKGQPPADFGPQDSIQFLMGEGPSAMI